MNDVNSAIRFLYRNQEPLMASAVKEMTVQLVALKEENERLKKKIDDLCYVISEDDKLIASLRKERGEQSEIHAKKYREIVALNARVAELEEHEKIYIEVLRVADVALKTVRRKEPANEG